MITHRSRKQGERASISMGDEFVVRSGLTNEAGRRVGTLHAHCHATRGGRNFAGAFFHCTGTFVLRDGLLSLDTAFSGDETGTARVSITGGTGAYEGARGSITSKELPRNRTEDTVHLLP